MYGLILQHLASYVQKTYGEKMWSEVLYVAGVDNPENGFKTDKVYPEGHCYKLMWAAADVTGERPDILMEQLGATFWQFVAKYEYDKVLRVLGRTFPRFLNGLDNLHEYLKFSYPELKPPSFYCEHESRTGITLHYRSKRRGFLHYVRGQVKEIAKRLYDVDVKIEVLDHDTEDNMQHVIMRLHFNNVDFGKDDQVDRGHDELLRQQIKITSDLFFDIFPFIIVFNRGMRIRNIGLALLRILPRLIGKKITSQFVLLRPFVRFRWEDIQTHLNNIFELITFEPIQEDGKFDINTYSDERELQEERRRMSENEKRRYLALKGQMMYMQEWESICFLGIPVFVDKPI